MISRLELEYWRKKYTEVSTKRYREVMGNIRVTPISSPRRDLAVDIPLPGTWVPLPTGRELAECNNVLHKLRPLFDYIPGDISPPPAPKHTTAASNKPKIPKPPAAKRIKSMYLSHVDLISNLTSRI